MTDRQQSKYYFEEKKIFLFNGNFLLVDEELTTRVIEEGNTIFYLEMIF